MRLRTLSILFLVVAALGSYVWFVERELPGSDERAERAKKVLSFEPDELVELSLERAGHRVAFTRAGDSGDESWRLVEPMAARADEAELEKLMTSLHDLEKERTLEEVEPEALGLKPPRAALTLKARSGESGRLLIGGDVPASKSMIVATGEQGPYFVAAQGLWDEIDREPGDWRSRKVFPGHREQIERLVLKSGSRELVLGRHGEDYFVELPVEDLADEGTVSRFLDALTGLEIDGFIDEPQRAEPASYGLESPAATVDVVESDGDSWRLAVGLAAGGDDAEDTSVYAEAEGRVFTMADGLGDDLARAADEWRSLSWSGLQAYEIDRLELADGEGELALERDGADWRRDGEAVEFSAASDLIYAIAGTKAEALDAPLTEGDPLLELTLNPGDAEQVLAVFEPTDDRYPATVSGRSTVLWLGGDRVRSIREKLSAVRLAEVSTEDASEDGEPGAPVVDAVPK